MTMSNFTCHSSVSRDSSWMLIWSTMTKGPLPIISVWICLHRGIHSTPFLLCISVPNTCWKLLGKMKLLFGTLLLTLISGTSCQLQPSQEQIQCFTQFVTQNNGGGLEVCGDVFTNPNASATAFCMNEDCLSVLDRIYSGCGFTNTRLCEFWMSC